MLPFSPPYIDDDAIAEVVAVLRSGWITSGPKMKALEAAVATYTGVPSVLCLNSATAGMELMLRWFGIGEGDEVIVPAYTYCATANVVLHCGATPVMVDMLPDFTISPEAVRAAITPRTKAIMPVDIGGYPCHYDALRAIAEATRNTFTPANDVQAKLGRVLILADAAHSLGATYKGRAAALYADAATYSFHAVKNLTTAEGGAIALNLPTHPDGFDHASVHKALYRTALHGQTKDAMAKTQGTNSWEYDVTEAGYKYNMPDILAAIGLSGLRSYPEALARRRIIFDRYSECFRAHAWAELPEYEDATRTSSYHLFLLSIRGCTLEQRNEIIRLIFEAGVSVNVHYKPLPVLSVYHERGYRIEDYPVSHDRWQREISLPVYYTLTDAQIEQVVAAVVQSTETVLGMP